MSPEMRACTPKNANEPATRMASTIPTTTVTTATPRRGAVRATVDTLSGMTNTPSARSRVPTPKSSAAVPMGSQGAQGKV